MISEMKKQIELLRMCINEAIELTIEVDKNVMAYDPSVWTLCSRVEEINELLKKIEEMT